MMTAVKDDDDDGVEGGPLVMQAMDRLQIRIDEQTERKIAGFGVVCASVVCAVVACVRRGF